MSGYAYNDREMMLAAQIAYLNIPRSSNIPGDDSSVNLGSLIDGIRASYGVQNEDGSWSIRPEFADNSVISSQFSTANNVAAIAGDSEAWRNWSVVDSSNKNDSSGFCACLIDTGDGNAIVGFRGSESTSFYEGIMDWGVADFGLLNNALTFQQADAEAYLREIWDKYGDRYNSFSLTGHSLGGNLAEHAAITAPDEMRNHIDHTISFDGPGYSNEYLTLHRDDIKEAEGTIDHYQWSLVGNLLFQPDGVNNRIIDAHDDPGKEGTPEGQVMRHVMNNVEFDGDNVRDGELDPLAEICGPVSRRIEYLGPMIFIWLPVVPEILLINQVVSGIVAILDKAKRDIEDAAAEISKKFCDLYNFIFGGTTSCEYMIETGIIGSVAEDLARIAGEAECIADAVDSIIRDVPYYSLSGAYYKSKIRRIARGIGQDADRIQTCSDTGLTAVSLYIRADEQAAAEYA